MLSTLLPKRGYELDPRSVVRFFVVVVVVDIDDDVGALLLLLLLAASVVVWRRWLGEVRGEG